MKVEKLKCDECGRLQDAANHWHRMGVFTFPAGEIGIELGWVRPNEASDYEVHDLCGQQCLIKHIFKLLKMEGYDGSEKGE